MRYSTALPLLLSSLIYGGLAIDISDVSTYLQTASSDVFPALRSIAEDVWANPEDSTFEFYAHARVVNYFTTTLPGQWTVVPHAFGQATAWSLTFENIPAGFTGTLPHIGFISEFDALPAVGHACGHNLILLNGLAAASMTREAFLHYNIPGKITLIGSPDEEQTCGKQRLVEAGAFDNADLWMLAHPTVTNAVQPMQARITAFLRITGATHAEAVFNAYSQLVLIIQLVGTLPATSSSCTPVEDVGMFSPSANVVQTEIVLGVKGDLAIVTNIISTVNADPKFATVNHTVSTDQDGIVLDIHGPGGHASEGTQGALNLAIEVFRQLSTTQPSYSYYLPSNTTPTELDVTVSVRTRYDADLPAVQNALLAVASDIPQSISWDVPYKSLEVTPYLGGLLIDIMKQPTLNEVWVNTTVAPAATDAGWVQDAVVDPTTRALLSEHRVMFHPNFGICADASGAGCPFNHEPLFRPLAATDLAYSATEKMARALAQIAVELAVDPAKMRQAKALVK